MIQTWSTSHQIFPGTTITRPMWRSMGSHWSWDFGTRLAIKTTTACGHSPTQKPMFSWFVFRWSIPTLSRMSEPSGTEKLDINVQIHRSSWLAPKRIWETIKVPWRNWIWRKWDQSHKNRFLLFILFHYPYQIREQWPDFN